MKRISTVFLQAFIILIGIGVLGFLLWEPSVEGVNAHATFLEMYVRDPFVMLAYLGSTPFFFALYQAFKVAGYAGQNKLCSKEAMQSLRIIKFCGIMLIAFITVPLAYLFIVRPGDDIAGGVAIGLMAMFVSVVMAAGAAMLGRVVQKAVDRKPENDMTI